MIITQSDDKEGVDENKVLLRSAIVTLDAAIALVDALPNTIPRPENLAGFERKLQTFMGDMLHFCSQVPAATPGAVALKLGLWRRDTTEFNLNKRRLSAADMILYRSFRDIVSLSDEPECLTAEDVELGDRFTR